MYVFVQHYEGQDRYTIFSVKKAKAIELQAGTLQKGETINDIKSQAKELAKILRADYLENRVDEKECEAAIREDRVKLHHAEFLIDRLQEERRTASFYEDEYDKANNRHRR